ncbi:PTS system trehalose-specific EIIBC component [Paenibacillus rhizophilus]|uniref:PTS trehalose transporter subunit IIBC n=1 Tax=Paenibacillus rhizophilus TaxID=1850366 RepID=A0A3N9Q133_9BACL|nr:PTS system trehalose-specific EIIBC component [Paenibacillus rhizophilus]RQW11206.1 PTS trehalose transporter subunit IIBC [Paenibacillus rhizophilus]
MAVDRANVEKIVQAVGGADNIEAATHCVTRLRFALVDEKKVDQKLLEQNDLVKGHFSSQGQFQVVIGPGLVDKVYNEMIAITGGQRSSKDDVKKVAGKKQNPLQQAIKTLADIFIPILPAIVTAGLLLGINNILTGPGIFFEGRSLVQEYPAWTDFAGIINLIANTAFTFLPALIGWSAATRFGGSPLLGIVLGLILVHPDLLNAWAYAQASQEGKIPHWNLFGWQLEKIGYQGQVLPVLVSAYLLARIERFLNKKVHDSIKLLVVAPVALLVTGFLAFTIIGPVTFAIGNAITNGLVHVFNTLPAVGGLLYGGIYALLVVTGMHHTFLAVDVQLIGNTGGTFLWPMLALSNIAQGSAALAMLFVFREQKSKGLAVTSSVSAFLGVTEPAIFGVNIRYKYPFIFGMIGSALGGLVLTINHVLASSIGVGGIPGFLSIFPNQWGVFFVGMAIVLVVPFLLTAAYGKVASRKAGGANADNGSTSGEISSETAGVAETEAVSLSAPAVSAGEAVNVLDILAPLAGRVVPLENVPDPAFAERQMGQGIAIEPSDGRVVAPFDAKVVHIIKSKHAIVLEHATGVQILIHVGINTVSLKGVPFTTHVGIDDEVKAGQLLIEFDREAILQARLPVITPIIIPDGQPIVERVTEESAGETVSGRDIVLKVHLSTQGI